MAADIATLLMMQQAQQGKERPLSSQRRLAQMLMQQGQDQSPIKSPWQGVARVAQSGLAGLLMGMSDAKEKEEKTAQMGAITSLYNAKTPEERATAMDAISKAGGDMAFPFIASMISQRDANERAGASADAQWRAAGGGAPGAQAPPAGPPGGTGGATPGPITTSGGAGYDPAKLATAVGGVEAGGKYDAIGPVTNINGKPSRPYGKYQVMDFNVGPWTQQILGRPYTPQEFLNDPKAQDTVFQTRIAEDTKKFGNVQDALSVWFSGRPLKDAVAGGNRPDILGTTPTGYIDRVNTAYGGLPQAGGPATAAPPPATAPPVQLAGAPGAPPPQGGAETMPGGTVVDRSIPPPTFVGGPGAAPTPPPPQAAAPPGYDPGAQMEARARAAYQNARTPEEKKAAATMMMEANKARDTWATEQAKSQQQRAAEAAEHDRREREKATAGAPQQQFDNATKIRSAYVAEPIVKAYKEITPIVDSIKETIDRSTKDPNYKPTRASDLNIVYGIAKIMDPIGVVRGEDTIQVNRTGGLSNEILGHINALNGGAALAPATRQALLKEAMSRYNAFDKSHNELRDFYGNIAKSQGIPVEHIYQPSRTAAAPVAPPNPGDIVDGHRFKGGDPSNPVNWDRPQ